VGHTGVRFQQKSQVTDFCWTADGLLARGKVLELLITERITGWRQGYVQVEATPKLVDYDLNYHELIVIGHTKKYGETVGLEIRDQCNICGYIAYRFPHHGLEIPKECWDGSDVFLIDELPGLYLFTDSVYKLFETHKFTSATMIPIAEWHASLSAQRE
jgi:hypothetical protein